MKTIKAFAALIAFTCALVFHGSVTGQYKVAGSVFGNGAGAVSGSGSRVTGTIGQPAVGLMSGSANKIGAGFWYQSGGIATDVEEIFKTQPAEFRLHQNYPNPFNPTTVIRFETAKPSHVTLSVYSAMGREVARLVDGELQPGEHKVVFDGWGLPNGVYFYRLQGEGLTQTRKLMLLK